jgi:predicted DNA-binding protein with PD1-like motif
MKVYEFSNSHLFLVLQKDEDILKSLGEFATHHEIKGAYFSGIGAADKIRLGQYSYSTKEYRVLEFKGDFEVTSLIGNISLTNGKPTPHAHITFTKEDGSSWGGHLLEGSICCLTMEIGIIPYSDLLQRTVDPKFNIGVLYM